MTEVSFHLLSKRRHVYRRYFSVLINHKSHSGNVAQVIGTNRYLMAVIHCHIKFFPLFFCKWSVHLEIIVELHILRLRLCNPIDIDNSVGNFKTVSGKTHATFHIIFTTVNRTVYLFSENILVSKNRLTSIRIDKCVVIRILNL